MKTEFFTAETSAENNIQARRSLVALASHRIAFCLAIASILSSCTIAPPIVTGGAIAIGDNGAPDAGILNWAYDSKGKIIGAYVDQGYVNNYRYLVKTYGSQVKPPVTDMTGTVHAHGVWFIDAKHAGFYAQMIGLEINGP